MSGIVSLSPALTPPVSALPAITAHGLEVQAVKTAVVFVALAAGLRLLGKREAGQLNVYDLAMLMALANAVQNAMTGGKGNLGVGLVDSSVVVLAAWALTRVVVRFPALEPLTVGTPTLLAYKGRVLTDRLRRQRVSREELSAAMRASGFSSLRQVHTAILEVDGSITIVGHPGERR